MSRSTICATLQLLQTSDGGRSTPLISGYRSLLRFEGTDLDLGFELELDAEAHPQGLAPGDSGKAQLSFWASEELPDLFPGKTFEMREGTRVVGHGSVVRTF